MKTLINALIIILILHFVIKNFEEDDVTGYDETDIYDEYEQEDFSDNDRLKYLMDEVNGFDIHTDTSNDSSMDYLQFMEDEDKKFYKNKVSKVKPLNYYEESESNPNFKSNVTDINKYFQTNYDSIVSNNLGNNKKKKEPIQIDSISKTHCYIDDKDNGCTVSNVAWKYKDEQVQNGGMFVNGITAFDGIGSEYAVYDSNQLNLQSKINDVSIPQNSNNLAI